MQVITSAKQGKKTNPSYTSNTDLSLSHTDIIAVCFASVAVCIYCPTPGGAQGVVWVQTHLAKHICAPRRAVLRPGGCARSPVHWGL